MRAPFEGRVEVIRRRASLLWGACVFVAVAGTMVAVRAPMWAAFVELSLACALVLAFSMEKYRVRHRVSLQTDSKGMRLDGRLLAREKVQTAYLLATERPIVHVEMRPWLRQWSFDVELEDELQARALLETMGFGLGQSVATFRAMYGPVWLAVVLTVLFAPAMTWVAGPLIHHLGILPGLLASEVMLWGFLFLVLGWLNVRVDVGSDGVLLRRLVGPRRFVSYRVLDRAHVEGRRIELSLQHGERIRLDLGSFNQPMRSRDALEQRIEEARAAFVASKDTASTEALVAPGGRAITDWLRDVRALARARDYRQARVEAERLWNVVSDASASPATRAGAAVALASAPDGDAGARLRVASEACADPRLRAALVRVADGASDDALADALAPLVEVEHRAGAANR